MAQQYYYTESETESDEEPSLDILESKLSDLSINKTSRSSDDDDDDATEEKSYQIVQNIIQGCEVGKLKVEQCKLYLRRHGLRLTGKKDILIHRIKEHLSIINGEGEHKYPAFTFLINCKGDACTGDVVMFQQNVYEMFNIASRSASGPPCGQRIVAGRIVNESYGAAKQQHTFTIEVLWSTGTKPLPPLHPLLIKGRNLYRLKTMRQRWEDESERHKILSEKHARGNVARTNRDARLHEKETNKALRASKGNIKDEKLQHKTKTYPTPPIITSLMGMDHRATATYKENMNPDTLRGGVDTKNMGDYYKNENQENKRNPRTSIQHSGAVFMGMDHGAPHNENMNPRDVDGTLRRSFQVEGFCPSRFFQRHDYDPQNLPRSRSFHNNGYLPPRDHYHNQGKRQQLCRYYAQGRCHYGTNCKYLH